MLNHVCVMGRMTADPELRHTQSGVAAANFRIAVGRDYKDKATGERGVDFFPVICWRATAEFVSRYGKKGRLVVVSGRLQVLDYTTKDGDKRTATEIVADNVYFGDPKRDGQAGGQDSGNPFTPMDDVDDGEIPF